MKKEENNVNIADESLVKKTPAKTIEQPDLLEVQRVKYVVSNNLSFVNKRCMKVSYADINQYVPSSREAIIKVTAGTDFIDVKNSYLKFTVKVVLAAGGGLALNAYRFPSRVGALALFNRLIIESRDGTQLEYIDSLDLFSTSKLYLSSSREYVKNLGLQAGIQFDQIVEPQETIVYKSGTDPNGKNSCLDLPYNLVDGKEFAIPMSWLSGIWDSNNLCPPQLSAGMRIRLSLSDIERALILCTDFTTNAPDGVTPESVVYQINNLELHTDSYEMVPSVTRVIQDQSSQGLQYMFDTAYYQSRDMTSSSVSFDISKSVSQAKSLIFFTQAQNGLQKQITNTASPNQPQNSYSGTTPFIMSNVQVRLGSLYFPDQKIISNIVPQAATNLLYGLSDGGVASLVGTRISDAVQAYSELIPYCSSYMSKKQESNCIDYYNFIASGSLTPLTNASLPPAYNTINNKGISYCCTTLEKSGWLEMSGLAINNSRSLVLNLDVAGTNPSSSNILYVRTFLVYTKVAQVFAMNVVIEE